MTNEADVKKAVSQVAEKFGRIDVVVNNAGFTHLATIEEMSDADAREEFDINVFGTLNVIRSVLPQMREQGSGHILLSAALGRIMLVLFPESIVRQNTRSRRSPRRLRRKSESLVYT